MAGIATTVTLAHFNSGQGLRVTLLGSHNKQKGK